MPASEGDLRFLDASQISEALNAAADEDRVGRLFDEARRSSSTDEVSAAQCRAVALSLISEAMCGVQLPAQLLDHALQAALFPSDHNIMDRAAFASKLQDLLQSIANALQENRLVVSILDGAAIKSLLEDEDDFAMLAENLFTELDVEDTGKVSPDTLRMALLQMGLEMGVPVPSANAEAESTISFILKKHESEGEAEIGQARFAKLLQEILEDLAESLALHPITVASDLNVNNGSQLRKLLDDEELFSTVADGMFDEFDSTKDGNLDRNELRHLLESRGMEWGLPPKELVGQLYEDLFSICDEDHSGKIDKKEFQVLLREIFETFALQLESNPIFMS